MSIVPQTRLAVWQNNVGVSGSIPTGYIQYGAALNPAGGSTDDTPAFVSALTAAALLANSSTGRFVQLNSGNFRISSLFDWQDVGNYVILRGYGTGTVLKTFNTPGDGRIELRGSFYDPSTNTSTGSNFTANALKGDTTFTLANAGWVAAGDCIAICQVDDTSFVNRRDEDNLIVNSYIYSGNRGFSQLVKIVNKTSNTLTTEIPLGWDFTTGLSARAVKVANQWILGCGIEDLVINPQFNDGGSQTIHIQEAQNCWLKNVRINNVNRIGVQVDFGYRIEVRHCYFNGSNVSGPGEGYGAAFYNTSSSCLAEDNIIVGSHLGLSVDYGTFGNVMGYNYEVSGVASSQQAPAGGSHGYHAWMTLWEGNYFNDKLSADNTHGSNSHHTALRNRIVGYNAVYNYDTTAIHGAAWNRRSNYVGNILGKSGIHATGYSYYPTPFDNSINTACFRWGDDDDQARNSGDNQATADLIVEANWDSFSRSVSWTITPEAIPSSYYLPSKPSYFGVLAWPPYTSSIGDSASAADIPAGYRFLNGIDPPPSSNSAFVQKRLGRHIKIIGWSNP